MKEMKILDLPLKKEWYEMIESGVKTEEYREIKPYWYTRFYQRKKVFLDFAGKLNMVDGEYACHINNRDILKRGFSDNEPKPFTHIRFRYGYTKRTMLFELLGIRVGRGNPDWGAPKDRDVFILMLGDRIK